MKSVFSDLQSFFDNLGKKKRPGTPTGTPRQENNLLGDIPIVDSPQVSPKIPAIRKELYSVSKQFYKNKHDGSFSIPGDDPSGIEKRPVVKDKCSVCGKNVYYNEKISIDGKLFHQDCFRCKQCKCRLDLSNQGRLGDDFFCKAHFSVASSDCM